MWIFSVLCVCCVCGKRMDDREMRVEIGASGTMLFVEILDFLVKNVKF